MNPSNSMEKKLKWGADFQGETFRSFSFSVHICKRRCYKSDEVHGDKGKEILPIQSLVRNFFLFVLLCIWFLPVRLARVIFCCTFYGYFFLCYIMPVIFVIIVIFLFYLMLIRFLLLFFSSLYCSLICGKIMENGKHGCTNDYPLSYCSHVGKMALFIENIKDFLLCVVTSLIAIWHVVSLMCAMHVGSHQFH